MDAKLAFLPLLLVLFLAFLVPPVLARFRWLPIVVGEIIVGMVVGRSGFDLVRPDATLKFLAEIGLAILMFLSGLEIDFTLIFPQRGTARPRGSPLVFASLSFALTVVMAAVFARQLAALGLTDDVWMVGLILSTTSLGVVLPVLKDRGISGGLFGQTLLLSALLADFITMFLITLYVTLKSSGLTLDILLIGILFVVALVAYRVGRGALRKTTAERIFDELTHVSSQTRIHAAIALLFAFVILADFLGAEMILGAFLAGAVLSLLSGPGQTMLHHKLDGIGFGFFIPIFFLMVGVEFDLPSLLRSRRTWLLAPVLLLGAYVIKIVPALIYRLRFSWKETFAGGVLLSARLSLIIAASGIGLRLGVIDEPTNAAFILIAAVTATLSPVLFNTLQPSRQAGARKEIAIIGTSDLALQTARELTAQKEKVFLIGGDEGPVQSAWTAGLPIIPASSLASGLGDVKLRTIKSLLILTPEDSRNIELCREARSLGIRHIVVLVNDPSRLPEFGELGVQTFAPALYRATLLSLMARNPDLYSLLVSSRTGHQVREIPILNPEMSGFSLKELRLGGDILVLSVHRGDEYLIPHGNTRLEMGDWVTVFGDAGPIESLRTRLEKP